MRSGWYCMLLMRLPVISAEVLDFDTTRGQVQLSLKALQEDPLVRFAVRVGEVLSGPVVKVVPFGVFVRVAPGSFTSQS